MTPRGASSCSVRTELRMDRLRRSAPSRICSWNKRTVNTVNASTITAATKPSRPSLSGESFLQLPVNDCVGGKLDQVRVARLDLQVRGHPRDVVLDRPAASKLSTAK